MTWQTQKEAEAIYSTINTETVKLRTRKTCYIKESRGVNKKLIKERRKNIKAR